MPAIAKRPTEVLGPHIFGYQDYPPTRLPFVFGSLGTLMEESLYWCAFSTNAMRLDYLSGSTHDVVKPRVIWFGDRMTAAGVEIATLNHNMMFADANAMLDFILQNQEALDDRPITALNAILHPTGDESLVLDVSRNCARMPPRATTCWPAGHGFLTLVPVD